MKEMVLGFLFSSNGNNVALIKKIKPEWQKGLFNGIGGKIEEGETPLQAITREFYEETGVTIEQNEWEQFAIMQGPEWKVYCFKAFSNQMFYVKTTTEETVTTIHMNQLPHVQDKCISNLQWLIPMALDSAFFTSSVLYNQ